MSDVLYLYGFVPPGTASPPAELHGVAGTRVRLLDLGAVHAAVSHIHDPAFLPGALEAQLDDLQWVGEQGLAHERVVAWFVDHADILPVRLFTMHSSERALREAVADSIDQLAQRLREFAGRREWNLKVAYDADALARHGAEVSPELHSLDEQIAHAPAGRRYLLERKRADIVKIEVRRAARRLADELFHALATHALATRVLPLTSDVEAGTVVLTAALLVERGSEDALQRDAAERIARLDPLGLAVTFSGPWAPYRFLAGDVVV